MRNRFASMLATVAGLAALAACQGDTDAPAPEPTAMESGAIAMPTDEPTAESSGSVGAAIAAGLDITALEERRDPEKLLRFYVNALRVGDWDMAARAWTLDSQMTPARLERQYGGDAGPKLAVGKGEMVTAAGRAFYEAPLVVDFADGRSSLRGTLVLTRINDTPGASAQQLNWRIERSSTATD